MGEKRNTYYVDCACETALWNFPVVHGLIPRQSIKEDFEVLLQSLKQYSLKGERADSEPRLLEVAENFRNSSATLFSHGHKSKSFFTEESGLYITPVEYQEMQKGQLRMKSRNSLDSLSSKIVSGYKIYNPSQQDFLYELFTSRYEKLRENIADSSQFIFNRLTPVRLWNLSIVGAILLGMVSMTFVYRYLGPDASAKSKGGKGLPAQEQVLGAATSKDEKLSAEDIQYVEDLMERLAAQKEKQDLEEDIKKLVKGYPIEAMIPSIIEKDKIVAAFIISIAKKESDWGRHVPVYQGKDCYNYWGWKGKNRVGSGGHTCFANRKEAVDTVANGLERLIKERKLDTAAKLVVWKCGSSCAGHGKRDVEKWISDVDLYFKKLNS